MSQRVSKSSDVEILEYLLTHTVFQTCEEFGCSRMHIKRVRDRHPTWLQERLAGCSSTKGEVLEATKDLDDVPIPAGVLDDIGILVACVKRWKALKSHKERALRVEAWLHDQEDLHPDVP